MPLKPEEIDHINLISWFNYQFPELYADFHHFANERYLIPTVSGSHWQVGRKLKRMGVKAGVADFFLAIPSTDKDGNFKAGLWIELKVNKNKPSPAQKEFLARKIVMGYEAVCVLGWEAGKEAILTYLKEYNSIRM